MPARIFVLAGVNGAGKSSIGGAALRARGIEHFDPDLAARRLREADAGLSVQAANARAWAIGRDALVRALDQGLNLAFETTLGARTIPDLLLRGAGQGAQVHVWYVGLASADLHVERVRRRVAAGGHDIPEAKIRERWDASRANLVRLLPRLAGLRVWDNSAEADPKAGKAPRPVLLLEMANGRIARHAPLARVPEWAKPILAMAIRSDARVSRQG